MYEKTIFQLGGDTLCHAKKGNRKKNNNLQAIFKNFI